MNVLQKRKFLVIAVFAVILILSMLRGYVTLLGPRDNDRTRTDVGQYIEIQKGMGISEIGELLESSDLIRSKRAFALYVLFTGAAYRLQAGTYFLTPSLSSQEIIALLRDGRVGREVTIPPGATLKDIDVILSSAGVLKSGELKVAPWDFLKKEYPFLSSRTSLEGYLFPDTYWFLKDSMPQSVLQKFLANFISKIRGSFPELTYDQLILASLVEKEASTPTDRALIAGVLGKRLRVGGGLHVDVSLVYMKCDGRFLSCAQRTITRADKANPSSYNTYLHAGLPPTPIGNPGLDALRAVKEPQESPFWYYLSDPKTGKTIYAETLDEQNSNRLQYL